MCGGVHDNPNGISIGSTVFTWLPTVPDRQTTDRPRCSVCNVNRPHLRTWFCDAA